MTSLPALLVLVAPLGFLAVAARARSHPGSDLGDVGRLGLRASWAGVVVAAAAAAAVAVGGPLQTPTLGVGGLGFSVRLDALSTVMLLMIALLAVVIFRFSVTYLDGDPRRGLFLARLAATIASVEVLVLAGNLGLLLVAWVATSLTLHQLLVFYPHRRGAVVAARKKFVVARLGDAFLVAAIFILWRHFGTGDIAQITASAPTAAAGAGLFGAPALGALCLVGAAALKSAQFPVHGWLMEVMETPTPVSALLHAGILNAGPFLVIRLAGTIDGAQVATVALIAIGGCTALVASIALLTQPSIKVVLGYSSAAHMGFMLMLCGMGFYAAALLHLVAHSFYKAHAFLSSGSVIDQARADHVTLPRRLGNPGRVLACFAAAIGLYLAFALLWGQDLVRDPALLVLGVVLVLGLAQILAPVVDSEGRTAGLARASLYALAVTAAFFILETGAHTVMDGTLPDIAQRGPVHGGVMVLVLGAFAAVVTLQIIEPARPDSPRRRAIAVHLRNGLYANVAFDRLVGALRTTGPEPARPPATPPVHQRSTP